MVRWQTEKAWVGISNTAYAAAGLYMQKFVVVWTEHYVIIRIKQNGFS